MRFACGLFLGSDFGSGVPKPSLKIFRLLGDPGQPQRLTPRRRPATRVAATQRALDTGGAAGHNSAPPGTVNYHGTHPRPLRRAGVERGPARPPQPVPQHASPSRRRGHMSSVPRIFALALIVALCLTGVTVASAQMSDKPLIEKWAPTEYGPDDKAGAVNRTTPAMVLKALKVVKQGKQATLGKLYVNDMINFGARTWKLTIPGTPTGGPFGKNALVYHDELVTAELGQVGTQFDGPGHIGVRTSKGDFYY